MILKILSLLFVLILIFTDFKQLKTKIQKYLTKLK